MKIGIGITTYNRPHLLKQCVEHIQKNTTAEYELYVATDTDENRRGVAKVKNECLFHLQHCDFIFLFDDDCYPIKKGWEQFVILAHLETKNHHFCYNREPFCELKNYLFHKNYTLESFDGSGGTFLFFTKEVIKQIGGFYTGYELYGFEHIGYSMRIKKAQMTEDWFLSIKGLNEYIYSLDYEQEGFFLNESSLSIEKKDELTQKNMQICNSKDIQKYQPILFN